MSDEEDGLNLMVDATEKLRKDLEEVNQLINAEKEEEKKAQSKLYNVMNRGGRRNYGSGNRGRGGFNRRGGFPGRDGRDRYPDRRGGRDFGRRPRRRSGSRDGPGAPFGRQARKRSRSRSPQRRNDRGGNDSGGNNRRYQRPNRNQIYGLAKSGTYNRQFRTDEKEDQTGEGKVRRGPYQPHLVAQTGDDSESSDEEIGLGSGLNQMMSLVSKPDDDGNSSSDSSDGSSESGEESDSLEKEKVGRKRKAPTRGSRNLDMPKRRRVEVINKLRKDKNHKNRSKRMFGFLMKHLGKAQKESKNRTDITRKMNTEAKAIREKQKHQVFSDFKERQVQIYEQRKKYRRQKIDVLMWKKLHAENLIRVREMKKEFEARKAFCITKAEPSLYFKFGPLLEGDQEDTEVDKLIHESNERMEQVLIDQITAIEEAEGEEPPEPAKLPREIALSPERGIRPNDENTSFTSNRKNGEVQKDRPGREGRSERGRTDERRGREVRDRDRDRKRSRRERSGERRRRGDRNELKSTRNITTTSFRSTRGGREEDKIKEEKVLADNDRPKEQRMQTLISMPDRED